MLPAAPVAIGMVTAECVLVCPEHNLLVPRPLSLAEAGLCLYVDSLSQHHWNSRDPSAVESFPVLEEVFSGHGN